MRTVGIDPGLNGGITLYDNENPSWSVTSFVMPTFKAGTKSHIDAGGVSRILKLFNPDRVVIEKVGAMPGQGVTSMFSFGYGAGMLEGIVTALGYPLSFVTPQAWMKAVLKGLPKTGAKSSVVFCARMFPGIDWRGTDRSRKPHDGKTDSCCIAMYLDNI